MKTLAALAMLALVACSGHTTAPTTAVSFDANGKTASTTPAAEETVAPSANYVKSTGVMTIYFYGAVPPDTTRRQFSMQLTGFKGGTGQAHVATAIFNRKDADNHEYQYAAKPEVMKVTITEFEIDDVPGSPLQEGWVSGTFEGEMPYVYPKKDENLFTHPLVITNGKFTGIKVSGMK